MREHGGELSQEKKSNSTSEYGRIEENDLIKM